MAKAKNEFDATETENDAFAENGVAGASFEDDNDSLVIDMESIADQTFEVLPKGTYDGLFESLEYTMSKSSGKPMWKMVIAITEGDYTGRKLFTQLSFSEKALPGTKKSISTFAPGLLTSSFNPKKIAAENTLVGKRVRVEVSVEKYEGEDTNRVKRFKPVLGGEDGFAT